MTWYCRYASTCTVSRQHHLRPVYVYTGVVLQLLLKDLLHVLKPPYAWPYLDSHTRVQAVRLGRYASVGRA